MSVAGTLPVSLDLQRFTENGKVQKYIKIHNLCTHIIHIEIIIHFVYVSLRLSASMGKICLPNPQYLLNTNSISFRVQCL